MSLSTHVAFYDEFDPQTGAVVGEQRTFWGPASGKYGPIERQVALYEFYNNLTVDILLAAGWPAPLRKLRLSRVLGINAFENEAKESLKAQWREMIPQMVASLRSAVPLTENLEHQAAIQETIRLLEEPF